MKKRKWLALVLALAVFCTGCKRLPIMQIMGEIGAQLATPFSEMHYTRPDMDEMSQSLRTCCDAAGTATNKKDLIDKVWDFYELYTSFYTQYNLATIYYFQDMTNTSWEAEYNYCAQNASTAEAMLEEMFYTLAACPLKDALEADPAFGEGFFDAYMGQGIWDGTFLKMIEKETELKAEYYDLCTQAQSVPYYSEEYFTQYGTKMAEVFVELIALRQNIAEYVGYPDYPSFAYDFYHQRDYTAQQAKVFLEEIGRELSPIYKGLGIWDDMKTEEMMCTQDETFSYVKNCAQTMGGTMGAAFKMMQVAGLYDITYSEKKYNGSFEVYLTEYAAPFVFISPSATQMDKLTFMHEFGHFCNDYATNGSYVGVDVAEFFSQGLEYLSLCYGGENLTELKMADSLLIYVEQAAYALFEHQVYALAGEELTVENVHALYEEIGTAFGLDAWQWDSRDYVTISHFFTEPMYVVSYVVSNDAAMQLYQLEQAQKGAGLALYEKELITAQTYFLAFLHEAGLESPFVPGRVQAVKTTFEQVLG